MAIISCRECKKDVSSEAKICPSCGAKPQKSYNFFTLILGAIIIALLIEAIPSNKVNKTSNNLSSPVVNVPNRWEYTSRVDEVSNKPIQSANLTSNNVVELDFPHQGGTYADLEIRYHPRYNKDIIFSVNKGQLNCQYNNCFVSIRFDDGEVSEYKVGEPSDRDSKTYFISNFNKTLNKIKRSKKMYIEVSFFQQGNRTFEFNTADLDTVKLALIK